MTEKLEINYEDVAVICHVYLLNELLNWLG